MSPRSRSPQEQELIKRMMDVGISEEEATREAEKSDIQSLREFIAPMLKADVEAINRAAGPESSCIRDGYTGKIIY